MNNIPIEIKYLINIFLLPKESSYYARINKCNYNSGLIYSFYQVEINKLQNKKKRIFKSLNTFNTFNS